MALDLAYDVQVLGQAALYFVIFIFGFAVSIPLGVTTIELGNHCILYTEFQWINATYVKFNLDTNLAVCNFPTYFPVFACILYGLVMGIYNMYAACSTKDPNVGYQMWIMPFTLVSALIAAAMFVVACIISVGMKITCDNLMAGVQKGSGVHSCADGVKIHWKTDYSFKHFYVYPKASEGSAWITFFLWLGQLGLYFLRIYRNRCQRSQGVEDASAGSGPQGDLQNFASVPPTA